MIYGISPFSIASFPGRLRFAFLAAYMTLIMYADKEEGWVMALKQGYT